MGNNKNIKSTVAPKKTDSEKKKIKQLNKAKANPEKAAAKKIKNDERQYGRGQMKRPDDILAEEAAKKQAEIKTKEDAVLKSKHDAELKAKKELDMEKKAKIEADKKALFVKEPEPEK